MAVNFKRVSFLLALVMTVAAILTPSVISGENGFSDLQIHKHLKRLNKPPLKSIKVKENSQRLLDKVSINFTLIYGFKQSPDGDVIDCVPITDQPALAHPQLINHTVQVKKLFCSSSFSSNRLCFCFVLTLLMGFVL